MDWTGKHSECQSDVDISMSYDPYIKFIPFAAGDICYDFSFLSSHRSSLDSLSCWTSFAPSFEDVI